MININVERAYHAKNNFFIILLYFYLLNSAFGYDAEIKKFLDQFDSSNRIVLNQISILANKTPTELSKVGSSVNIYSKRRNY